MTLLAMLALTLVLCTPVVWRRVLNDWRKEGYEADTEYNWLRFYLASSKLPLPWWLVPWIRWTEGCDHNGRVYIWKEWQGQRYDIRSIGIRRIRSKAEYHKAMNGEEY